MAEAANLSVAITGDASGLMAAVSEAREGLASLEELSAFEAKPVISAVDNTAEAVRAAKSSIDSVEGKTVTISVNYKVGGTLPFFAGGTDYAPEGLAMVNDERGVSDPRELIYHNGRYMMFDGRDVLVPLKSGDRVYTAEQTKKIMQSVPHYARGWKNELFDRDKSDFKHWIGSANVPFTEQIDWWKSTMSKYAYDSEAVKECNDEIFSLTRKLADNINSLSEIYVSERAHFNDFEDHGDTAIAAFDRVKERNYADMQSGIITWEEYVENVSRIGSVMYEEKISQSEHWLKSEKKYNNLSLEDYIAGLERMKDYTEEYYQHGIIGYREYRDSMQAISEEIADIEIEIAERDEKAEKESHRKIYEKWLSDAQNWKKIRDTYDDWSDYDDSPVKFYERCIERIEEMYKAGHISWQEYMDETMNYSLDLYNAKMSEADELLEASSARLERLKTQASESEKALKDSWEESDRKENIADVKRNMAIYKNAVTQKGMNKYSELAKDLKRLEREEELLKLQKSNNAAIAKLESEYEVMESNKKSLITSIDSSGINIERLINGINNNTSGIGVIMTNIALQIIKAINSKSTYSDNRSFNISADSSTLKQFTKNMEETIARGRYY